MILSDFSTGTPQAFKLWVTGITVGEAFAEGAQAYPYARGTSLRRWSVSVFLLNQDAPALGGNGSATRASNEIHARQLEELAGNYYLQPTYIQWFAGGSVTSATQPQDGWYILEQCKTDYKDTVFGIIAVTLQVVFVSAGGTPPSIRAGLFWAGGALSSTYTGTITPWLSIPFGGSVPAGTANRVGGESNIPFTTGFYRADMVTTPPNPFWFKWSSTISQWFQGGCRVYDTINTGANPVPSASSTFVNANWVLVNGADHVFTGDIVITNGLLLILFQIGQTPGTTLYCWDSTGTPNWRSITTINYQNDAFVSGTLTSISWVRIGQRDVYLTAVYQSLTNARLWFRLEAGSYCLRVDFQPLSENNTNSGGLFLQPTVAPKIVYNDSSVVDEAISNTGIPVVANYGYGAVFSTGIPVIAGLLWQKPPAAFQPHGGTTFIGIGDNASPSQYNIQSYGVFAAPFSASINNIQSEGESGALGTGWSSLADGTASAGNTAKAASGTLINNADTFGTSWVPPVGIYDVWFRVKVTSIAGSASEMTLGLWDATSAAFVASGSTTFKANQSATTYAWLRAATNLTPTAAHNMQFRAVTAATLGTDWFIDEAVLVPKSGAISTGVPQYPQDLWQQFMWSTTQRIV